MNVRDKSGATLTPQMQSNRKEDRKLLAAVRRTVVDDNTLSTSGQNVKILARDGVVTLRGPVDNESEKNKLGDLAKQVAGVTSVLNQLDVKTK
ncbi:hyperosmotically inducible protein [Janthinobacterium sp. B9-8]|nr:hyperosmotically inducible protein [Janthinobacterium sp. B9-8]